MKNLFVFIILFSTVSFSQKPNETKEHGTRLPASLIEGRFFLKIPTVKGDSILGFCDTGGGYTAIYASTVSKLQLNSKIQLLVIDKDSTKYILAKDIYQHTSIPYPEIQAYFKKYLDQPFYQAPDDNNETRFFSKFVNYEAFLGQFFFINHAWTFDYLNGTMFINTPISKDATNLNIQNIGFKKDLMGNKRFGHPSMKLEIDGKVIDFLFDTGATFLLSDSGKTKLGIETKVTAGSFIAKSIFNEWRQQHPDWKVIEKGEFNGADMIQVPIVKVGNLSAGPVWFSKRPDEAWSKGMIGSMDKIVKGAIGGSFLKYFKVTIDYNNELIQFQQ